MLNRRASSGKLPLVIAALWVAEVTGSFETAMIFAALKRLIEHFGDPAMVGWLITGYLIVGAGIAAIVGRLGDLLGRRQVLIVVLILGAFGSVISALSTNFPVLLVGRLIQGVTGAILPLCIGLVQENAGRDRAPMWIGFITSGASVGIAAGLIVGGVLVDHFSWHAIFVTSAALCTVSALAVFALLPPSPRQPAAQPIDWISGLAFAPGVALVLLYFSMGKTWGWGNPLSLLALGFGLALTVWWWRASIASNNPLIAVRSFLDPTIAVGCAVTALAAMSTLQITVFFTLLMQAPTWTIAGLGLTATASGLAKLPSNLSSAFAGPLGGWLAARGRGRSALVGASLITGAAWLLWFAVDVKIFAFLVAQLILISFSATILFSVAPTVIAQASPPERISEISGMLTVIRQLFLGVGAQMVTTILAVDVVRRGSESYPSPFAYDLTVGVIAAICVISACVALALPRHV